MKPQLLVVELWGLGDLLIATPFLQAASQKYAVTLLAKPYAKDLQARLWRDVEVAPFIAPWTAFKHKYRLFSWPWREILNLRKLMKRRFEAGRYARDRLFLRLPVLGHTIQFALVERFCRILSSMVSAGVSLPEAMLL